MWRWLLFPLFLAAIATSAQAASGRGPVEIVKAIYAAYRATEDRTPDVGPVYSRRLQALIAKDHQRAPEGEPGNLDWDVFVDGQDWEISAVEITLVAKSTDKAEVKARFENFGEPREIVLDLIREDGRWVIDEVRSALDGRRWSMSKVLTGAPGASLDQKGSKSQDQN